MSIGSEAAGDGIVEAIRRSGRTIYDSVVPGDPRYWLPARELERLLSEGLRGVSLEGLPLRTRSKVVKEHACRILGYPVPSSFRRTRPRFPGQRFDLYVQKSDNLQIWNEDVEHGRRYVVVKVGDSGVVVQVRVATGQMLASLDRTGTLTRKYQARLAVGRELVEVVTAEDTESLAPVVTPAVDLSKLSPTSSPQSGELLPIGDIVDRLRPLLGRTFVDAGRDQERRRGAELQRLVCMGLGYSMFGDDGQFPDVRHQLLELKLQTTRTIDLGLACPNSVERLDLPSIRGVGVRHCDVRYALFHGTTDGREVQLTRLCVCTGERFFARFPRIEGKGVNRKLQIRLPADFFT